MRTSRSCRCSYVVAVDREASLEEVRALALHLSQLHDAECEMIILDPTSGRLFEERRRILRWVGRHLHIPARYTLPGGETDLLQAAADLASYEKIIAASAESRYTAAEVSALCAMLEQHDVVEPQEFVRPMPWWGGVDAAAMLLRRGVDQTGGFSRTFAFRKSAWRPLRGFDDQPAGTELRRLMAQGAEVMPARDVFVRNEPPDLGVWLRQRGRRAEWETIPPLQAASFAGLLPFLFILYLLGGGQLAGGYAGLIALGSVVIAVRGRWEARRFFPLRACFYAPLWLFERAISVYWTLFARLRRGRVSSERVPAAQGEHPEAANR